MLGVRDGYQNDAACTAMRAVRCPIVDGGTQWMVLSAAIKHPTVWHTQGGTWSITLRLEDAFRVVIVEHEDVGDDRRRHQDDMRVADAILAMVAILAMEDAGTRQGRRRSVDCGVGRVCATTAFASKPYVTHMYI